jgi:hypothetical protein
MAMAMFAGCASTSAGGGNAGLPAEMTSLLREGKVDRTRTYLDMAGRVEKTAFYVGAADLPKWVLDEAERRLGQGIGEGDDYEVEHYPEHGLVYEVKRVVAGKARELSFKADRSLLYEEVEVERSELPDPVRSQLGHGEAAGFALKSAVKTTWGDGTVQWQLKLIKNERQHRQRFDKDGVLVSNSVEAPGKVEIIGAPVPF